MPVLHNFISPAPPVADPTKVGSTEWNEGHAVSIDNADVVAGAAIDESKLNLNYATHASVTLGASPNGLSLAGQVLSLGLASSGTSGALSSVDYNLIISLSSGTHAPVTILDTSSINLSLVGQLLSADAIFGTTSGTVAEGDHSHSGYGDISGTGVVGQIAEFVTNTKTIQSAKLIAPTGAILTLINASAKSITFPGVGNDTVALLGTANVFTLGQKINCNSTTAFFVEQDGVKDNAFIVDTTNLRVGIGMVPGYTLDITTASSAQFRLTNPVGSATIGE